MDWKSELANPGPHCKGSGETLVGAGLTVDLFTFTPDPDGTYSCRCEVTDDLLTSIGMGGATSGLDIALCFVKKADGDLKLQAVSTIGTDRTIGWCVLQD